MSGSAWSGRGARVQSLRGAAGRGIDLVTQVADTIGEALRTRRDPVLVAQRRRLAARRRVMLWSLIWVVLTAIGVGVVLQAVHGDASPTGIGILVLVAGLWAYSVLGATQAVIDLRVRTRVLRRLPPPQPVRRAVTGAIRPLMARLDGYSDALRHEIGMLGTRPGAGAAVRELRDETLAAADAAESRLRRQAAELTAMTRSGSRPADPQLGSARAQLQAEIGAGIDEYGRLVDAAADAAAASRDLTATTVESSGEIAEATERLTALAAGMRELTHTTL